MKKLQKNKDNKIEQRGDRKTIVKKFLRRT